MNGFKWGKVIIVVLLVVFVLSSCMSMGVPSARKLDVGMSRTTVDRMSRLPDELAMQLVDDQVLEYWAFVTRKGELQLWFCDRKLVGLRWVGKDRK